MTLEIISQCCLFGETNIKSGKCARNMSKRIVLSPDYNHSGYNEHPVKFLKKEIVSLVLL